MYALMRNQLEKMMSLFQFSHSGYVHFQYQNLPHLTYEQHQIVKDAQSLLTAVKDFPEVVCLCGSTRFMDQYIEVQKELSLQGKIVLSVGLFGHKEGLDMNSETKKMLDRLHFRKIEMANSIYVINVGGYVGESTKNEIEYAIKLGKKIYYLEQP